MFLSTGNFDLAKERFDKALEYNNIYPFAFLGLAGLDLMKNLTQESIGAIHRFRNITEGADLDVSELINNELNKLKKQQKNLLLV